MDKAEKDRIVEAIATADKALNGMIGLPKASPDGKLIAVAILAATILSLQGPESRTSSL